MITEEQKNKRRNRGVDGNSLALFDGKLRGERINMSVIELRESSCTVLARYVGQVNVKPCMESIKQLNDG